MDDFEKQVDRPEQERTRPTTVPGAAAGLVRAAGGFFKLAGRGVLAVGRAVRSILPRRS
jgi:hypothetical protein